MAEVDSHKTPTVQDKRRVAARSRGYRMVHEDPHSIALSVHVNMQALEADWRALERGQSVSLHQSFDWCNIWAQTHDNQLLLVRGRIGDRTMFILPLELVRGRLFRSARFIGSPHSNMNTGLFAGDFDPLVCQEMAGRLLADLKRVLARVADIVTLEKIPLEWRGVRHPFAGLPSVRNQNSSYQLPLFASFEQTLAQINAKRRRKKFRLSQRRLEALGGYDHIVADTPEERTAILETFFQQKAIRFDALGLPDVFRDAPTRAFFRDLAALPSTPTDYPLRLHAIRLRGEGERPVLAIAGISRKGDHVICQFGSIDETIAADSSPGELLFYHMIEALCADGVALFDFGIGDQGYKRSWCTVETHQSDIILPLTARGRLAAASHRLVVRTKAAIKTSPRIYAFVQRIRKERQEGQPEGPAEAD